MAYSKRGKDRRLTEWDMEDDQEEMPDRSIGKVSRADVIQPVAPASQVPQAPPAKMARTGATGLADYLSEWGSTTPMDWGSIAQHLQSLGIGEQGRDGAAGWQYNGGNPQHDGGGPEVPLWSLTDASKQKLAGYTIGGREQLGAHNSQRAIYDPSGAQLGASQQDESNSMPWMEPAVMAALGAIAGPMAGGLLGGGVVGGALGGAATGGLLADAFDQDVGKGALMGGIGGGFNGYMQGAPAAGDVASSVAGVPGEAQAALDAYAQSPIPDMMQGMPDLGGAQSFGVPQTMPSWLDSVHGQNVASLDQFAQQPMQMPMPEWQQATAPAWLDSVRGETEASLQQASQQTQAQVNATMPDASAFQAPVPTSGVSDFRAEEIRGYQTDGSMPSSPAVAASPPASGVSDFRKAEIDGYQTDGSMPSSPAVPTGTGGLLGSIKAGGSTALDWMKTNPGLAKLLLGGAGSLLSTQGGAGGGAPKPYGAPVQWNSAPPKISPGILGGQGGGQSSGYPPALGLMGGQANSGAWRFLGG